MAMFPIRIPTKAGREKRVEKYRAAERMYFCLFGGVGEKTRTPASHASLRGGEEEKGNKERSSSQRLIPLKV